MLSLVVVMLQWVEIVEKREVLLGADEPIEQRKSHQKIEVQLVLRFFKNLIAGHWYHKQWRV
jgi:hypothetical protein